MKRIVFFGVTFVATDFWLNTLASISLIGTGSRGDWTPQYAISELLWAVGMTLLLVATWKVASK